MISKEDIKALCHYESDLKNGFPKSVQFVDYETGEYDEIYQRQIKMKNRELAVDAILEDKVEEYNNRQKWQPVEEIGGITNGMGSIGLKVYSIGVPSPVPFISFEVIWDQIMNHIESSTKHDHTFLLSNNISNKLVYQPDSTKPEMENLGYFSRKIFSRIMSCGNMIASALSRRGPGNLIIVGNDVIPYMHTYLLHIVNLLTSIT